MKYFTSLTFDKTTCPRCNQQGNLVINIYKSDNKTSHKVLIRHINQKNPRYCYLGTVTVPHISETKKYSDALLCVIYLANVSGAKKIEISDDEEIKLYYPRYTITLKTINYDKLVEKTIQYSMENLPETLSNIVNMLAEMLTSCYK